MDKYIKLDDILDAIYPVDPENDGSDGCTVVAMPLTLTSEELEVMLDKIPAADVAPVVHARWVKIYDDTEPASKARQIAVSCSKCMGIPKDKLTESAYCPHCGAKMDGKGG